MDHSDPRFIQLMRNKIDFHHRNLRTVQLEHRISGREAIEEMWIPLFKKETRELWLQEPVDSNQPLWDRFLEFHNHREPNMTQIQHSLVLDDHVNRKPHPRGLT